MHLDTPDGKKKNTDDLITVNMRPKVSITGNITAQKCQTTVALDGSGAPTAANQEVTPPKKKIN